MDPPETRYARSGDVNIAYQVVGEGPLDLVFVMGWVSHLEYFWEEPSFARFLARLASFSRLILFDKRGTGLSDRVPLNELPTLEQRMDDVRAVMDAVGSERAALLGVSEGGPMCALFAATYPERTAALVMIGTYAKRIWDARLSVGADAASSARRFSKMIAAQLGRAGRASRRGRRAWRRPSGSATGGRPYLRMGASPGAALALTQMNAEIDVRHVLPTIRVPTLVSTATGDRCVAGRGGRATSPSRSRARGCVELPGDDHLPFVGDQDAILDEIEEFLTGVRRGPEPDRVLATVLFTDIVGSTERAAELGDQRWQRAARAAPCARAPRARPLPRSRDRHLGRRLPRHLRRPRARDPLRVRDSRLGRAPRPRDPRRAPHGRDPSCVGDDVARHRRAHRRAGRRARGRAEVLVSSTVKDLVAGSGIEFEERGEHELKGVPGEWRLYAVEQ